MNTKKALCPAILLVFVLSSCGTRPTAIPVEPVPPTTETVLQPFDEIEWGETSYEIPSQRDASYMQPFDEMAPWQECSDQRFIEFTLRTMPLWREFWELTAKVDEEFLANNTTNARVFRDQAWDLVERLRDIGYPGGNADLHYMGAEDSFTSVAESLDTFLRMGNEGLLASTQFRESVESANVTNYFLENIYYTCGGPEPVER